MRLLTRASLRGWRNKSTSRRSLMPAGRSCTVSIDPNTPTPSAICWHWTSTSASLLPPDDSAFGFDNISDALGVSPSLQEHYLDAALKIGALAVGDPKIAPGSETWRIRQDLSQDQHVNGLPLGTVGGTMVRYNFPLDGEYSFQANLYRTNLNIMRGLGVAPSGGICGGWPAHSSGYDGRPRRSGVVVSKAHRHGRRRGCAVARSRSGEGRSARCHGGFSGGSAMPWSRRGCSRIIRSSVDNFDWSGSPHLQALTVAVHFIPRVPATRPAGDEFLCVIQAEQMDEDACARQIVSTLARRAYRQPPG